MDDMIPKHFVGTQINASDMALPGRVEHRVKPVRGSSHSYPSSVTETRKDAKCFYPSVSAIDVVNANRPVVLGRVNKLAVLCGLRRHGHPKKNRQSNWIHDVAPATGGWRPLKTPTWVTPACRTNP